MSLVCCGIDEAGYGPMLGPLVVAMSVLRVKEWDPATAQAPDFWELLDSAVCRGIREARSRIAVADSKKLKLPNSSKTRHPLLHLERGVLSFLASAGHKVGSDDELFGLVGAQLEPAPWYGGGPTQMPIGSPQDSLGIDANRLALALERAGVELLSLRVRVIGERRFNDIIRERGTKAAATGSAVCSLIAEAKRRWAADHPLRLVVDRQSGRANYIPMLSEAIPGCAIDAMSVSETRSSYTLSGDGLRDMRAHFMTEAEEQHMPVAIASMAAKLVRELAMHRFNSYWSGRISELKPTAGYVADARRWLHDAGDAISAQERAEMIRLA